MTERMATIDVGALLRELREEEAMLMHTAQLAVEQSPKWWAAVGGAAAIQVAVRHVERAIEARP